MSDTRKYRKFSAQQKTELVHATSRSAAPAQTFALAHYSLPDPCRSGPLSTGETGTVFNRP